MTKKPIVYQHMCSKELVCCPREPFLSTPSILGQSAEVLQLLKNRHLRAMINMVDRSTDPAEDMQKAMMEPIFVQLVDQLLAIAEHREK